MTWEKVIMETERMAGITGKSDLLRYANGWLCQFPGFLQIESLDMSAADTNRKDV